MYIINKLSLLSLISITILYPCSNLFSEEPLYQNKPSWWDKINIKIIAGKNYSDSYYKTFGKLDYGGEKIENWSVLGPLDNNNKKPFEKIYGPEKTLTFNKKEVFTGFKGVKLKWGPWRKGEKCPVAANVQNCVIFLYSIYKSPQPGKHYIIFSSDDGAELWINKKKVFQHHAPRGMDFINPDIIKIELKRGKNEILVKLEQASAGWGLSLQITKQTPQETRLKALAELYNKAPKITLNERTKLSRQFEQYYLQQNDFPNYIFWFNNEFMTLNKGKSRRKTYELSNTLKEKEEFYPYIVRYFKDLFTNPKLDRKIRIYCAEFLINKSFEKNDFKSLENFLSIYKSQLKSLMPNTHLATKVKIQIRKGDFEEASKLMEELKVQCKKTDLRKYQHLFASVSSMKSSTLQLPIDWDIKTIQAKVNKYANDKKLKINRFIRKTLTEKAHQLIPTNKKELFTGALPIYKKMFTPFIKTYSTDLQTYLSVLKGAGKEKTNTLLQREALLSLPAIKAPAYKDKKQLSDINSIHLPSGKNKPFPFLNMHKGAPEMHAEINFIAEKLEKQTPAVIASSGTLMVFQNYHEIVCLENNKLKWKYSFPNSIPHTLTERNMPTKISFGKTYPLIDNGKIFTRLFKDGRMTLFCFDAANGNIYWLLSDQKLEICSEISLWRDQLLFLAKEPDTISRYYLIEANKKNGKILRKTFLYGADISFRFYRYLSNRIQADLFIPSPLIIGNQAYITTNSGIVASFDIMTSSFNWAKKYNKASFTSDEKIARTLSGRSSSSPIASSSNVLFQPLNSASLILVNKVTGKQVANAMINWKKVIPCGRNQIIIIDDQENAAFYSLDDLKKKASLPGAGYRFIQQLNDGVILQTKNKLVIYDFAGKLKQSFLMPENSIAVFADKNSLFAYNDKSKNNSIIEKFLLKKPAAVINAKPDNTLPAMYNVRFKTFGKDNYLISDSAIIKLNPDASPTWIHSIPKSNRTRIYQHGNYTYIFSNNQIFCLDKNNGKMKNCFPAYGDQLLPLVGEIIYPHGVAFLNQKGWNFEVFRLTPEKTEKLGKYIGPTPIAAFENAKLLATWKKQDKDIRFLRKDPKKGDYSVQTSDYKLQKPFRPHIRKIINNNAVLLTNLDSLLLVNTDKTVNEYKLAKGKKKISHWQRKPNEFFIYNDYCVFRNYFDFVNIFDLKRKKELGRIPKFTAMPIYINNKFIGIASNNIVCFDPETEKIIYKTPHKMTNKKSPKMEYSTAFKLNNKAALFFNTHRNDKRTSEEGIIILSSPNNPKPEKINFPGAEINSTFLDTGDALLITLPKEKRVIKLSKKEFNDLKNKAPKLYTTANTPFEYTIDGYPDEWVLNKFHKLKNNRFDARIVDKKHLILAIELNDKATINEMGKSGIDKRYKILLAPGPVACLKSKNCIRESRIHPVSLYTILQSSKKTGSSVAYSVKPDGSSCFIEIKVPLDKVFCYHFRYHKNIKPREWRGDLAFELFHTDKLEKTHSILSSQEIPAFFPRIFFPDLKF
jgi:outer membrane protein assembly factor BamB